MKRFLAGIAIALIASPAPLAAASIEDLQTQVMYVLGQMAQLQARASGASLSCMLIATKTQVHAGEEFTLIWNTYGAVDPSDEGPSQYAPRGIAHITFDKTGTLTYMVPFTGGNGAQTTCTAAVTILP
jgi:hypothetical protein